MKSKATIAGRPIHSMMAVVFGVVTVALFAVSGVMLFRGVESHLPFALAMVGLVSLTYAGALRYLTFATLAVGKQPVRNARPARITALRPAHY